jgi:hypothetical protein
VGTRNPEFLDFERTDGDAKQWPTNTKEVVDADGNVNYMKPIGTDDGQSINWRSQIALKIAERLGKPCTWPIRASVASTPWPVLIVNFSWSQLRPQILAGGVSLVLPLQGKAVVPSAGFISIGYAPNPSTLVLFRRNYAQHASSWHSGSVHTKRFRSVPEFVPHAIWLMTDPTLDRGNCECKYCAKVPQRFISENLGYKSRSLPSTPGHHRIGRDRERRSPRTAPGEYATVRRAPKPKQLEKGPTQFMLRERYTDVQAMYCDTSAELRRWYRIGELVWCALEPPIHGVDATITFWPGLVDDRSFKAETLPRPKSPSIHSADGDFEMEDATDSAPTATQVGQKAGPSNDPGNDGGVPYPITPHPGGSQTVKEGPLPWIVRQKTVYKVKLLGVNHDYVAIETQVLPYQGYTPSHELLQALQNVPIDRISSKPEEIAAFNPCPSDVEAVESETDGTGQRFADATAPYTLAVDTAVGIATCWTPTDDWVFKMVIPTPSPSHPANPAEASSSAPVGGEPETYSLRSRPPPAPLTVTQTRYQGLWLGAERIWADDLVRLKAARGQIAPQGSPQIMAPSGPSKSTIAELGLDKQMDEEVLKSHGARDRGVFMQLEALFVVDVPDANGGAGTHTECRASGMLYELADEDWEEPSLEGSSTGVDSGEVVNAQDAWAAAGLSSPTRTRNPGESPELHVGKPFMSAPSPLKQPPVSSQGDVAPATLPIANAVPSGASVSTPSRDRNKQRKWAPATTTSRPDADTGNTQLSHPKRANAVPLPPAPRGFRFRPILPEGFEVVISLALISGRYYPRLLAHPMLRPIVRDMQGHANEAASRLDGHHLFALEGILPGFFNASEATQWKASRAAMVWDAANERSTALVRAWDARRHQAKEPEAIEATEPAPVGPADDAAVAAIAAAVTEPDQVVSASSGDSTERRPSLTGRDGDGDRDGDVGMQVLEPAVAAVAVGISTSTTDTDGQATAVLPAQNVPAA